MPSASVLASTRIWMETVSRLCNLPGCTWHFDAIFLNAGFVDGYLLCKYYFYLISLGITKNSLVGRHPVILFLIFLWTCLMVRPSISIETMYCSDFSSSLSWEGRASCPQWVKQCSTTTLSSFLTTWNWSYLVLPSKKKLYNLAHIHVSRTVWYDLLRFIHDHIWETDRTMTTTVSNSRLRSTSDSGAVSAYHMHLLRCHLPFLEDLNETNIIVVLTIDNPSTLYSSMSVKVIVSTI